MVIVSAVKYKKMRKDKLRKFNVCVSFIVKDEAGFLAMGLKVFKVDNYNQPHNNYYYDQVFYCNFSGV